MQESRLRRRIGANVIGLGIVLGAAGAAVADDIPPASVEPFEAWIAELRAEALAAAISPATLEATLDGVRPLPRVIELDRHQPEFEVTFGGYLDRVINDRRVRDGRRMLARHRSLLEELDARYDVQPRFLVALWGIETDFGRRSGSFPVIAALVTLAHDGRRGAFFRRELLDALRIVDEGAIEPGRMLGSWAGAMGQTQFMPSSFRRFAVDHDGDSRRDIWGSVPDALASAANYLAGSGWRGDLIWGREVRLPAGADPGAFAPEARRTLAEWSALGVRRRDGRALPRADVAGSIVRPGGADGPAYLVYDNYRVLLKWNRSDYFATAVGILSDRIAGRD